MSLLDQEHRGEAMAAENHVGNLKANMELLRVKRF
jgi:hypothetical protein